MRGSLFRWMWRAAILAAVSFRLDAAAGPRRRLAALIWALRWRRRVRRRLWAQSRDISNRLIGWASRVRSWAARRSVEDDILAERVRAKVGHMLGRSSAVEADAHAGNVTLRGAVPGDNKHRLPADVMSMYGVSEVENRLNSREGFEKGVFARGRAVVVNPLLTTAAGLMVYGLRRGGVRGRIAVSAGIGLAAWSWVRAGRPRMPEPYRSLDARSSQDIQAPLSRVFEFWENADNFPLFLSFVRQVTGAARDRYRWLVGPPGATVEWDAVITRREPPRILAWRTVPGSPVQHAGLVRFRRNPDESTHMDLRLSFSPGRGLSPRAAEFLFGADQQGRIAADLDRVKEHLEKKAPLHAISNGQAEGA